MRKTRVISILFGFGVFFWLLPLTGEAATTWNCNCASQTIQSFITDPAVVSGDTISVTGICNENVDITKSGITINGNNTAEIHGPFDPQNPKPAVRIRAGVIILKNFHSIQGG